MSILKNDILIFDTSNDIKDTILTNIKKGLN